MIIYNNPLDFQQPVRSYWIKRKSENMKLKFKSSEPPDLYFTSILKNLDLMLNEQRAQRIDLANILRMLNRMHNENKLQTQVDDFYQTSPQTESVEQNGDSQ